MNVREKCTRGCHHLRRGAILVIVAIAIPVLVMAAGFAVNIVYMQMVQDQLQMSCDSAAKAALINYGATQSQATARTFARTVSGSNRVAGQSISLPDSNIVFGNAVKNGSGMFVFTANRTPLNSVQVTGSVTGNMLMTPFLPSSSFTTSRVSLTTRVCHDIVLVLDRSASMAFDLSANQFSYPPGVSTYPLYYYFQPPHATLSRWAALTTAVNSFTSTLQSRSLDVKVSLVTYSENYTLGNLTTAQATLDVTLTSSYSSVTAAMNTYGTKPLLGDTNISAGLALAQGELTGIRSRSTADRTIILFTDGVPTTGNTNIASITQSYRTGSNIMTHVITLGAEASSGTYQSAMQSAATNGNGLYFNAPTSAQLTQAFTTIADSLPAVLVQ